MKSLTYFINIVEKFYEIIKTIMSATFTAFRCVITCSLVETVENRQRMNFR